MQGSRFKSFVRNETKWNDSAGMCCTGIILRKFTWYRKPKTWARGERMQCVASRSFRIIMCLKRNVIVNRFQNAMLNTDDETWHIGCFEFKVIRLMCMLILDGRGKEREQRKTEWLKGKYLMDGFCFQANTIVRRPFFLFRHHHFG